MKKAFLLVLSFILIAYVFVSCSKDKKEIVTPPLTTLQKIQAKWLVESIVDHLHDPTDDTTLIYDGVPSDYVDFKSNGKVYLDVGGSADTSTYAVVGDTSLLLTNYGTYKIQSLTDHILKLFVREDNTSTGFFIEETINLKK